MRLTKSGAKHLVFKRRQTPMSLLPSGVRVLTSENPRHLAPSNQYRLAWISHPRLPSHPLLALRPTKVSPALLVLAYLLQTASGHSPCEGIKAWMQFFMNFRGC